MEYEARLFLEVHSDMTKGNSGILERGKSLEKKIHSL